MLHIFIPKIWNHHEEEMNLTTVVTASMLLSSIVRTLVTRFKGSFFVHEALVTADKFIEMVQRMKYLLKHEPLKADKQNFKVIKKAR
jgi:hypothetical protein